MIVLTQGNPAPVQPRPAYYEDGRTFSDDSHNGRVADAR